MIFSGEVQGARCCARPLKVRRHQVRGWPPADTSASTPHQSFFTAACTTTEGETHCVQQPQRAGSPDERNPTAPQMAKPTACTTTEGKTHCVQQPQWAGLPSEPPQMARPNCTTNGKTQHIQMAKPNCTTNGKIQCITNDKTRCITNDKTHCVHDTEGEPHYVRAPQKSEPTRAWHHDMSSRGRHVSRIYNPAAGRRLAGLRQPPSRRWALI